MPALVGRGMSERPERPEGVRHGVGVVFGLARRAPRRPDRAVRLAGSRDPGAALHRRSEFSDTQ
eukprot:14948415-Alexandrium_andersonii.AAC.1